MGHGPCTERGLGDECRSRQDLVCAPRWLRGRSSPWRLRSRLERGRFGTGVASITATPIAVYFLHLRYDKPFNRNVFVSSLLFVGLFLALTLMDLS